MAYGVFTSGLVADSGHRIALFFTGRQHAGENLAAVLGQRAAGLAPPVLMCDALSRNVPAGVNLLIANCLAHYPDSEIIWSSFTGTL